MRDRVAVDFERQFLAWLHIHFGVEPVEHSGTNAYYWTFPYKGSEISFTIVGQGMNSAYPPPPGSDWLLRIEEPEDTGFVGLVAFYFKPDSGRRRRMSSGRFRTQFKSQDLVRPFEDQTYKTGAPPPLEPKPEAPPAIPPDIQILMGTQWPLLQKRHQAGNLSPCGAFMNVDGRIFDESLDDEHGIDAETAINRLASKYREGLRDNRLIAAAVYMHAAREGDRLFVANAPGDQPAALVGYLQHARGEAVQAVMMYERSEAPEALAENGGWLYERAQLWRSSGLPVMFRFGVRWFAPALEYGRGAIRHCAIDPAGRVGLVMFDDGSAWKWTLDDADRTGPLKPPTLKGTAHALDAQRCRLLQGEANGALVLHDLVSGEPVRETPTSMGEIACCAISADGRVAVAGSVTGDILFWDLEWGNTRPFCMTDPKEIRACALSPDGTRAITVMSNGHTTIWSVKREKIEPAFEWDSELTVPPYRAAASANGRFVVVSAGQTHVVWDWEWGTRGPVVHAGSDIDAVAISPNGQFLLLGLRSGLIRLWSDFRGAALQDHASSDLATAIAFAPDGGSALIGHASGAVLFTRFLPM